MKIDRLSEARGIQRGEQALAALRPHFRPEVVDLIVTKTIPAGQRQQILQALSRYQRDSQEMSCRVRLSVLKLSQGNTEELRNQIHIATQDVRDVLMPAENPTLHEMGVVAWSRLDDDEKDRISNNDVESYLNWINNPG